MKIVLASSSINRLDIMCRANIEPDFIISPDIDETPKPKERKLDLVKRLAEEKNSKVADNIDNGIIISADTIVVCKGRILDKASSSDQVRKHLQLLSGGSSQIITALNVVLKEDNIIKFRKTKLSKSKVKFKILSKMEIEEYVNSGEGIGKAGGFSIDGCASHFVKSLSGSVSGIIGLPLYELILLFKSMNYDYKIKSKD